MSLFSATLLYKLQQVDLALAQRQARINEIDAIIQADQRLHEAGQALEQAQAAVKPLQAQSRALELEIQALVEKIAVTNETLYSGRIKNPKEMTEMQAEIAALGRRRSQLEDEQLEILLRLDGALERCAEAEQALAAANAAQAGEHGALLEERAALTAECARLSEERSRAASAIDRADLERYEALRRRKGGRAVALLHESSCDTCGVEQTTVNAQLARQGKALVFCESCGRILAIST
ncbi:MAG: hypothetical protein SNJ59_07910 [Aggregatilineales bacterium]